MNKVILIGRLAKDIEVKYTQSSEPLAIAKFTMAVDRPYSKKKNDYAKTSDFFNCTLFGKRAEVLSQYVHKGNRLAVSGRIQIDDYTDKDGNKKKLTDIIVEDFDFIESKSSNNTSSGQNNGFYESDDEDDIPDFLK